MKEYTFNTVGPSAQDYLVYPSSTFDVATSSMEDKKIQHMRLCYPWREIILKGPKTRKFMVISTGEIMIGVLKEKVKTPYCTTMVTAMVLMSKYVF